MNGIITRISGLKMGNGVTTPVITGRGPTLHVQCKIFLYISQSTPCPLKIWRKPCVKCLTIPRYSSSSSWRSKTRVVFGRKKHPVVLKLRDLGWSWNYTLPKTNSRSICWTLANCKFFWIRFLGPKAFTSPPLNALRVRVWNLFHPSPPECFDKGHKIVNTPIPFPKDMLSQEPGVASLSSQFFCELQHAPFPDWICLQQYGGYMVGRVDSCTEAQQDTIKKNLRRGFAKWQFKIIEPAPKWWTSQKETFDHMSFLRFFEILHVDIFTDPYHVPSSTSLGHCLLSSFWVALGRNVWLRDFLDVEV